MQWKNVLAELVQSVQQEISQWMDCNEIWNTEEETFLGDSHHHEAGMFGFRCLNKYVVDQY